MGTEVYKGFQGIYFKYKYYIGNVNPATSRI